ncbi:hypothetical protein AVEN_200764-1 [Araneus ventricosus]|uniref:Uncharacterized protein n=1 Tax=Araneus ventricosus TaxID=182803 RepID=A0A4Y2DZK1_ARAVE|nr:hypothetical protein AVEN_200764-1 [Araneus ventricosus]
MICTDSARQYYDIQNLFKDARHKRTNHKIGQFVDLNDRSNTINDLENENKHLNNAIVSRRTPKMLAQYMALHYYRRTQLDSHPRSERLGQLLADTAKVYPGYGIEGLKLVQVEEPTVDSEEIGHLIKKRPKIDAEVIVFVFIYILSGIEEDEQQPVMIIDLGKIKDLGQRKIIMEQATRLDIRAIKMMGAKHLHADVVRKFGEWVSSDQVPK